MQTQPAGGISHSHLLTYLTAFLGRRLRCFKTCFFFLPQSQIRNKPWQGMFLTTLRITNRFSYDCYYYKIFSPRLEGDKCSQLFTTARSCAKLCQMLRFADECPPAGLPHVKVRASRRFWGKLDELFDQLLTGIFTFDGHSLS